MYKTKVVHIRGGYSTRRHKKNIHISTCVKAKKKTYQKGKKYKK